MSPTTTNPLVALRRRLGASQQHAANAVHVSRATWSAWELCTRPMWVHHLTANQDALGARDDEIASIRRWLSATYRRRT